MKIALFSDVHGNSIALEAVLADIAARGGADQYWVVGDLTALGPDPVGALARLAALPGLVAVRGNTDRYTVRGDRPDPTPAELQANPTLIKRFAEVQTSFAWTQGMITAGGWYDWLAALPVAARLTLPDGTRLLAAHAAPGRDDGPGLMVTASDRELQAELAGAAADLVVVGHTHLHFDRVIGATRLVNLGSVANPYAPDRRASYSLLTATPAGYELNHYRVAYDLAAADAALTAAHHPAADYMRRFLRGEMWPPGLAAAGQP